ncbi:histidine phosphatase family protein [Immundisolibacter sp.]|uniref:SixA phosphatase family protein n=1 Tax=Immundisolibacter sp. TaxID=1934948 RepID=UPI002639B0AF|nr:histidine phosphatase family protein [Immundisolibacter sp.]MDD3652116.1 histidine phosphatase family protein [Immundisolibacter sp.]
MRCLVIRHAPAESGFPDAERPLSAAGAGLMRQLRGALQALVPDLMLIAHSPLRRARETAALLAEVYAVPLCETDALAPGRLDGLSAWLAGQAGPLALVGHEDDLSYWTCHMLTGLAGRFFVFERAGACLLEFPGLPRPGGGRLHWLMAPEHLARMARR